MASTLNLVLPNTDNSWRFMSAILLLTVSESCQSFTNESFTMLTDAPVYKIILDAYIYIYRLMASIWVFVWRGV